jgi:hypothetical protein
VRISRAGAFRDALPSIPLAQDVSPINGASTSAFDPEGITQDLTTGALEEARARCSEVVETPSIRRARTALRDATVHGDVDGIIVANLELVRRLVDEHRLEQAVSELERALEQIGGIEAQTPQAVWRLQLTLAALYDGVGDRDRALEVARTSVIHARRVGSAVGDARARALVRRLSRPQRS